VAGLQAAKSGAFCTGSGTNQARKEPFSGPVVKNAEYPPKSAYHCLATPVGSSQGMVARGGRNFHGRSPATGRAKNRRDKTRATGTGPSTASSTNEPDSNLRDVLYMEDSLITYIAGSEHSGHHVVERIHLFASKKKGGVRKLRLGGGYKIEAQWSFDRAYWFAYLVRRQTHFRCQ
jgi:hypothetical protein